MKKRLLLLFVFSLLVIGIMGVINISAQPPLESKVILPDSGLMLVVYQKVDQAYMFSIRGPATFVIKNNAMYQDDRAIVNMLDKVGYEVHPYKEIIPKYEGEDMTPVPQYMTELGLLPMTSDYLPHSQHIAKLVAITPTARKPATVTRKFLGETYTVNCLVSQTAKDLYQAGILKIGDYVTVSFIDEIPDSQEYNLAVVVDKVWKSW